MGGVGFLLAPSVFSANILFIAAPFKRGDWSILPDRLQNKTRNDELPLCLR